MEIKWNTIYTGDNMPVLKELVDNKILFDLVLTDSPYNIGKDFGNDTDKMSLEDFLEETEKRIYLLDSMLSNIGSVVWFCTHRYAGHLQMLMYKRWQYRRLMIWHYKNGMSRQTREPVTEYDPFLWFSKTENYTYNMEDIRVPYRSERVKNPIYKKDTHGNKRAWYPNPDGAKRGDVWEYPTLSGKVFENERTEHPTQKPEDLVIDLIKAFCPKGLDGKYEGNILDPFLGSGTTAVCIEKLNRQYGHRIKWVGIELEEKWVSVSNKRIEHERNKQPQVDLF